MTQVAAGNGSTCALDSTGTAYCWGHNANGELGNNSAAAQSNVPVTVGATTFVPGLTIALTASAATTTPGSVVAYTVTVTNSGQTAYTGRRSPTR